MLLNLADLALIELGKPNSAVGTGRDAGELRPGLGTVNFSSVPSVAMRPTLPPMFSANQIAPSGPSTGWNGAAVPMLTSVICVGAVAANGTLAIL